jgi:uncharacterized membrane protein
MSTLSFSRKEALTEGWNIFKQRATFLISLYILSYLAGSFFMLLVFFLEEGNVTAGLEVSLLLAGVLAGMLLSMFIAMGIVYIAIRLVDGHAVTYNDLLVKKHLFLRFLGVNILYGVVVTLGLIAFIIPGIYLAVRYYFVTYLVVDKEVGIKEAFQESTRITQGIKKNLFLLILILFAIMLAVIIPFAFLSVVPTIAGTIMEELVEMIGYVLVMPYVMVTMAYVYRKLTAQLVVAPEQDIAPVELAES